MSRIRGGGHCFQAAVYSAVMIAPLSLWNCQHSKDHFTCLGGSAHSLVGLSAGNHYRSCGVGTPRLTRGGFRNSTTISTWPSRCCRRATRLTPAGNAAAGRLRRFGCSWVVGVAPDGGPVVPPAAPIPTESPTGTTPPHCSSRPVERSVNACLKRLRTAPGETGGTPVPRWSPGGVGHHAGGAGTGPGHQLDVGGRRARSTAAARLTWASTAAHSMSCARRLPCRTDPTGRVSDRPPLM